MGVIWSAADVRSELTGMSKLLRPQNSFYCFGRIWKNLEAHALFLNILSLTIPGTGTQQIRQKTLLKK
jgi:hypothetical protein